MKSRLWKQLSFRASLYGYLTHHLKSFSFYAEAASFTDQVVYCWLKKKWKEILTCEGDKEDEILIALPTKERYLLYKLGKTLFLYWLTMLAKCGIWYGDFINRSISFNTLYHVALVVLTNEITDYLLYQQQLVGSYKSSRSK